MKSECRTQYVTTDEPMKWDRIVDSFFYRIPQQRSGWARAFETHGDGEAFLWYCETEHLKAIDILFIDRLSSEQTAAFTPLSGTAMHIEERRPESPDHLTQNLEQVYESEIAQIFDCYDSFCRGNHVRSVQAVFRYDAPDTYNREKYYSLICDIPTYIMHMGSPESVLSAMHQEQRRNLKKGVLNGIRIEISDFSENDADLMWEMYTEFIDSKKHFLYYDFGKQFFRTLAQVFQGHVKLVKALDADRRVLTQLLLITGNGVAEVFLVANTSKAYELHSNTLLYYELTQYAGTFCPYLSLGTAAKELVRFKLHLDRNGQQSNHQMERKIR